MRELLCSRWGRARRVMKITSQMQVNEPLPLHTARSQSAPRTYRWKQANRNFSASRYAAFSETLLWTVDAEFHRDVKYFVEFGSGQEMDLKSSGHGHATLAGSDRILKTSSRCHNGERTINLAIHLRKTARLITRGHKQQIAT